LKKKEGSARPLFPDLDGNAIFIVLAACEAEIIEHRPG